MKRVSHLGYEVKTTIDKDWIVSIIANKEWLISLADNLIALAHDECPSGYHIHLDQYNYLEDGSSELIIQKK